MFDTEDPFAAELELAKAQPVAPKGGARRTFRPRMEIEIAFAKAGAFTFDYTNPKTGKVQKKMVDQLKFIIVEGQFFFQQWDRTGDKVKMACTTTKHSVSGKTVVEEVKDAETETRGVPGTWSIPYDRDEVIKRYAPQGSKMDPELGVPLTCGRCVELGLNEECGEQGNLFVYILQWPNEDGELIDIPGGPFLAAIKCPKASAKVFYEYARKLYAERELSPPAVVTVANIVPTFNGISNKLELHAVDPASAEQTAEARATMETFKSEAEAKREKDYQDWKSKNGGGGKGGAGGGATAKKAAPAKTKADGDDFNF